MEIEQTFIFAIRRDFGERLCSPRGEWVIETWVIHVPVESSARMTDKAKATTNIFGVALEAVPPSLTYELPPLDEMPTNNLKKQAKCLFHASPPPHRLVDPYSIGD
jgi:hypothetical protein